MINIIFAISIILVIGGWIATPVIVKLLAKGFEGEQFALAVKLTRIGLPMILFGGIIYQKHEVQGIDISSSLI